jgi:UDP-N-acetyl-2-amino-2-deoxyglucuronate dehydrogenase
MKKYRVGLIGLGEVAEVHLEAYKNIEGIEVVAGAELGKERLNRFIKQWKIHGYTSYEEMLRTEQLDIACVLTPARAHREVMQKVADYGVHVLCEKPLAVTLADAEAMIEACKKKNIKLCYGASYRYLPACRKAKEIIDKGLLGNLSVLMECYVGGQGIQHWKDLGPGHYPEGGPGGGGMGLMDHGIHLVDLFLWYAGSGVEYVVGRGNYSGQDPNTEFLTMIFKNGTVGQLVYNEATFFSDMPAEGQFSWGMSWDIHGCILPGGIWDPHPGTIRVHGEKGALRIFPYANKLFFFTDGKNEQIDVENHPMPSNFTFQMESFVGRLGRNEEPEVTGRDGWKTLEVVLAGYRSFETKKMVPLKSEV